MENLIRKEILEDGTFGGNFPYGINYPELPEKCIDITEEQRQYIDDHITTTVYDSSQDGIFNGNPKGVIDISQTPDYLAKELAKAKEKVYYNIISKYDQCLKNGIFKIDSEYYGNMSWYDTWTKAVALYESGLILADTFTVRLYKSPSSEDRVYYNYNTTQNLTSFKLLLQALNSQQFLLYQPIRNNLISQLKLATTVEQVNIINSLIEESFGDIIDETTTIVQDGE